MEKDKISLMMAVRLIIILALSILLVLVIVQNPDPMRVRFLWFFTETTALFMLLMTALVAFLLGRMSMTMFKVR
ncbi:MAG: hypothetical protein CVU65_14055 [Deltaproteobacteria bacterium HGW-Deltaproteobacteria-22]|jgi:uncharacterized integral membrane protein|nr:MAG: hypothetical protein CVU65_14055 [Deltaproteobacteria bacterium HGW-Deltaproteobacteria-22]